MKITDEQVELIMNFGALEYDSARMSVILDVEKEIVDRELLDKNSVFSRLIRKGKDMFDYVIDLKLFELAQTGDIKALEKLEARKKLRK